MEKNINLNKAKSVKNDEFYTKYEDIRNEIFSYKEHLLNKTIYCNCDKFTVSNFIEFFIIHFKELGIKKFISTSYEETKKQTIKHIFTLDNNEDIVIKEDSINGNGDFRNQDNIDILKEVDIVITNPPFSLFREYIAQLITYQKKFLVIGNENGLSYKEIFSLIMDNKIWLGIHKPKEFIQPDGNVKKFGNICWFTNLENYKEKKFLDLTDSYKLNSDKYVKYDNYNAIEVPTLKDIPYDFEGIMGVPITFLDKYNPLQFKIIGITNGRKDFDKESHPIKCYISPKQVNKDNTLSNGSKVNTGACILLKDKPNNKVFYIGDNIDGFLKRVYIRILIKKI